MGRKAGHLALGIGKAAGATVTVVPEEFNDDEIRLRHVVDVLAGTMIKRLSENRRDGVAIIAEGVLERMRPDDFDALKDVGRDAHGHIRLGEISFGPILKAEVAKRLRGFGIDIPITTKDIGYELRAAEPIPFDMEYTRDLGFCAAQFIINGGTAAMVSITGGRFHPLYFKDMVDPATNRTRVRLVDIESEYYHIARRYMLRLHKTDLEDRPTLERYAAVCGVSADTFRDEFQHVIANDRLNQIRVARLKDGTRSVEDVMTPF